ncbi:hypothetical protein BST81_15860 [Leptolyngbya sp. 'hensonii']|uniref:two-partner secretion domain-containing protein n=1 Tax=Leptolyngbya sp. 'hensonii' TaxID=1922337 RepID=UPI00095014AD|nr:filamentous hemagglutinin N-terminal domain-containing protein [Leptolyngbya sp. 'hensonii']OLP17291.1 hypothetical protein BST81_15860 [Leptolyngbya sp. 'hensonii']
MISGKLAGFSTPIDGNRFHRLSLALSTALISGFLLNVQMSALAQIVPDNTLGSTPSIVTPGVEIKGLPSTLIQGGAQQGSFLFQSFQQFNVGNGQQVYFNNPAGIQNILSRVTGSQASQILGTLGVLGNANLFLINPNGIYFGPNSRLDISGSFVASTADRLTLGSSGEFSAVNPQAPPLLTVNVPIGVQFGNLPTGAIVNAGDLKVGQDLTLSGSSVTSTGQLTALQGQVTVESVVGNVQVQTLTAQTATLTAQQDLILPSSTLNTTGNLTLQAQGMVKISDSPIAPLQIFAGENLQIQGNSSLDITALQHPGSILVAGQDLILRSANPVTGDGRFFAGRDLKVEQLDGSQGDVISPNDPIILAIGNVKLGNYVGASLHILAGGSVETGNITINAIGTQTTTINPSNTNLLPGTTIPYNALSAVKLSNGTDLTIGGDTQRTLDIRAGIDWNQAPFNGQQPTSTAPPLAGFTPNTLQTPTLTGSNIKTGAITISNAPVANPALVYLTNQYSANPLLSGDITTNNINVSSNATNGGTVVIDSRGAVTTLGATGLSTNGSISAAATVGAATVRNGGQVTVLANGPISTATTNVSSFAGNGGNVLMQSKSGITLRVINASALQTQNPGNGGTVTVLSGGNIEMLANPGAASGITSAGVQGGLITLQSQGDILAKGKNQIANESQGSQGSDIIIQAKNFYGTGTLISTSSTGTGAANASNINIQVDGTLQLIGGSVASNVAIQGGTGNAGKIEIQANQIQLLDGATVSSENAQLGTGKSGDILLKGTTSIELNNATIRNRVALDASGSGGTVTIQTGTLTLSKVSTLFSQTEGTGTASQVSVWANQVYLSDQSSIDSSVSNGKSGMGGMIQVQANTLKLDSGAKIIARTAGQGDAGTIVINVTDQIAIDGDGTGIFANTIAGATGKGGDIKIDPNLVILTNGATISVNSQGSGPGGSIFLQANNLTLNNGKIVATSSSTQGGNIFLTVPGIIQMTNNSQISATSGITGGAGDGGNITISTLFLVALPNQNSDITANAFLGKGGNIQITAQALFGIAYQSALTTPQVNTTNDITASSTFGVNGVVIINTPGVDPSKGLGPLPGDLVDASRLVAQGCGGPAVATTGRFVLLGQGGLPANPGELLTSDATLEDTRLPGIAIPVQPTALLPDQGKVAWMIEAAKKRCYDRE